MAQKIIFLRHGSTDWNREGRLNSYTDTHLNEEGRLEAKKAGHALAHEEITSIVVSPSLRAIETAHQVCAALSETGRTGIPTFVVEPSLCEISFGPFEGHTIEDIERLNLSDAYSAWTEEGCPPGGRPLESFDAGARRAKRFLDLWHLSGAATTLAITHGHFCRILFTACVLGAPPSLHRRLRLDNAHFAVLANTGAGLRQLAFNSTHVPF